MTDNDWDLIMKVHLKGSFSVARAAWNIMREKGYGRIVNTGSSSGNYGSFGQVNYAAAKMGIHGFSQSLAKEGEKRNIKVNTIVPVAGTRMTETVMPKEIVEALKPEYVAPLVLFLSHDSCPINGGLIDVGAGFVGVNRWQRTKGVVLRPEEITPENIAARWGQISDFSQSTNPSGSEEIMQVVMQNIENKGHSAPSTPAAKTTPAPVAKTTVATPAASTGAALKADEIFNMMASFLDQGEGKALVPKVAAVFEFEIVRTKGGKVEGTYTIDLKNG